MNESNFLGKQPALNEMVADAKQAFNSVAFSPDSSLIFTAHFSKSITVWDTQTNDIERRFLDCQAEVWSFQFCGDGSRFVAVTATHLLVWAFDNNVLCPLLQLQWADNSEYGFFGSAISYDGQRICSAHERGVHIWTLPARPSSPSIDNSSSSSHVKDSKFTSFRFNLSNQRVGDGQISFLNCIE
jgi:WD40 repeat protein